MPDTTSSDDLEGRLASAKDHLDSALRPSPPPFGRIRQRAARRRTQGAVVFCSLALVLLGSLVAVSTQRDGGERVGTAAEEPEPPSTGPTVSDPASPATDDPDVSAAALWAATLAALDCIDVAAIGTTGPWPDAAGEGVHYEVLLSPSSDTADGEAVSQDCLAGSEDLAATFALQESPSEQEALLQIRTALVECLAEADLPAATNEELATTAQEHPAEVRACARQVSTLVAAIGVDGTPGYVLTDDLEEPAPATPEEAAEHMEDARPRMIPLYASDGVTVIGEFEVGGTPDPMPDEEQIPPPSTEPAG